MMSAAIACFAFHSYVLSGDFVKKSCIASAAREAVAEGYWTRRSELEETAATRKYRTSPEWDGLADIDKNYVKSLRANYELVCPKSGETK
jgi:hypothetical protein